ncbi:hypothetical protein Vadar_030211 [Vaccinium darrowii]|uniref:Uncharacterized protein n=1 Tax=Vaccinium darrowii TaxID=229202 RepID=A0ACB7Z850_9ERIC|nr:hypothetical protein Vadar_030211 [Vaccinium darrowii]
MKFLVVLDTGSDLFWVPCDCRKCTSSEGKPYGSLELKYTGETNTLQPSHEYVPCVVVDRQPFNYDDYENFISYICEAYKGATLRNACIDTFLKNIRKTMLFHVGAIRLM